MKKKIAVYWARRDLRLQDNPALSAAATFSKQEEIPFFPLFILEDYMRDALPTAQFGYPSRYFLSEALPQFAKKFPTFAVLEGKAAQTLIALAEQFSIELFVNEDVYPDFYKQIEKLQNANIKVQVFADALTVHKETRSGTGGYYSVFTPFKKAVWQEFVTTTLLPTVSLQELSYILPEDLAIIPHKIEAESESLRELFSSVRTFQAGGHLYDIDTLLQEKLNLADWYFSEEAAHSHWQHYLKNHLSTYKDERDSLEKDITSRMSLALAWGLVSARTLTNDIKKHFHDDFLNESSPSSNQGALHYISELLWREFYKYLFAKDPSLMNVEFQPKFRSTIAWVEEGEARKRFTAWIQGKTGYKIVDAAMMQLAQTGFMHNRARMVVASVLTKNLGVDWRWGQEYFRAMLIDLDEASNNGGWQWGASVGADPKPIRIFNPYLQAEKFDTDGVYQKKWLGTERFEEELSPIVEHKDAREEALNRYGLS